MLIRFRKILFFVVVIVLFSLSMNIFTEHWQKSISEEVWSLNFSQLWIRTNGKISNSPFSSMKSFFIRNLNFETYKKLLQTNGNLETTMKCVGSPNNHSCLFKNLYYVNRTFWVLTTKQLEYPFPSVRTGTMVPFLVSPHRRRFYSSKDLREFVQLRVNPLVLPHLTVHFDQPWLMNIGHALFDGLYPAYLALIRFSPRHLQSFRILLGTSGYNGNHSFTQQVYYRFAGLETINGSILEEMSLERWFAFEEFLMGTGDLCQRCLQSNLQLAGGIELNGTRLFRDRMYERHGLVPPIQRRKHSGERRNLHEPLMAVVIDNKRFTTRDRIEIGAAIEEINRNPRNLSWPLVHVSYLSYSQLTGHHDDILRLNFSKIISRQSKKNDRMKMHLQLLREIDIHLSGPGTGQMYQSFLQDGSVHINLGAINSIEDNHTVMQYTSFMEQYLTAGTPYIKGLYYPIHQRPLGIKRNILLELIRQAAQLIQQGFSLPVNPRENLAADGQLFIELCQLDEDFCRTVTHRWQKQNFWCFSTWPETIIYEDGPWSPQGFRDEDKNVSCPINRTLLHQLREKYNLHPIVTRL